MPHRLSIIVPVYNEARTVVAVIDWLLTIELPVPREIVVVNDGSTDGTREVLDQVPPRPGVLQVVHAPRNGGNGSALWRARHRHGDLLQDHGGRCGEGARSGGQPLRHRTGDHRQASSGRPRHSRAAREVRAAQPCPGQEDRLAGRPARRAGSRQASPAPMSARAAVVTASLAAPLTGASVSGGARGPSAAPTPPATG